MFKEVNIPLQILSEINAACKDLQFGWVLFDFQLTLLLQSLGELTAYCKLRGNYTIQKLICPQESSVCKIILMSAVLQTQVGAQF